jgi:prepilin-type N-terminal cleavage/methylation domain-containing protein
LAPALYRPRRAFTLLELLVVIALVGILVAMVFPGVRSARIAAKKALTKAQFNQWVAAIEAFRSEYGYYPAFDVSGLVNGGTSGNPADEHLFHDVLAGRRRDGSAVNPAGAASSQNRKSISFYAFGAADLSDNTAPAPNLLRDAFDNTAIAVLVDRDLDGYIRAGSDYASLPAVGGLVPGAADFPAEGIRAGVVFYAPAPGANAASPEFITSWK